MVKCSIKGCNRPAEVDVNGKPFCRIHAPLDALRGKKRGNESQIEVFHPFLLMQEDPLTSIALSCEGFMQAYLPLKYSVTKGEEGESTTSEIDMSSVWTSTENIDWEALVGAEPRDELKGDVNLVLAAEMAEREGVVTTKKLAKYLAEHPASTFKEPDEDKARELLNKLAEKGIVKKYGRAGRKGMNIYKYHDTEKSWRKSE